MHSLQIPLADPLEFIRCNPFGPRFSLLDRYIAGCLQLGMNAHLNGCFGFSWTGDRLQGRISKGV